MERKKLITRRRRWKRFKIGAATVLLHKPRFVDLGRPSLVELGPLVDICMGGLAVCYIENKKRMIDSEALSVEIPDEGIRLDTVPFRTVSDREIGQMPDGKIIRHRCVMFEDLNAQQQIRVETFIRNYTMHHQDDRRSGKDRRQHDDPRYWDPTCRDIYERRFQPDRRTFQR